ncbi:DNA repair protein RecN [Advenella alkanexedens]|uniref:DNA repair protein RecN n=1 Tax=Advenella alkanexedens TaxID=1481665 RepID=A0ABS6NQL3_9BURK|nr:DNA repair protein RecN [Advenella alkanexedens]MBV4397928.1 DNA repair protein RecN [Advenella alkanexedens]
MLHSLHIRDFVIVDQVDLHFDQGFTVFSGETGAGKSILIDALALALGGRAETYSIREGADKTDISAVFDCPDSLRDWLQEQEMDDSELVLRRVFDRSGKSRAFINGVPANLAQLRSIGQHLVDIHGQHAHQSLLKNSAQRELLDAHADNNRLLQTLAQQWKAWQSDIRQYKESQENAAQQNLERERLEWQLQEIAKLQLGKNEWENVSTEHNRLAHASSLLEGATQTLNTLDDEEQSLISELNSATQRIAQLLKNDPALQGIYDALESARIACVEAASDLNSYLDKVDLDPLRLAELETRMRNIFDTAHKFRVEPEQLHALEQELEVKLAHFNKISNLEELEKSIAQRKAAYMETAQELSKARKKTASTLGKEVTQAMQSLAMQGGVFEIHLQKAEPGPHGLEQVEFNVAGHAGTTPRPLAKVASGGELARISLALSVMANKAGRVPTLIFDEVDTGIGGAVAEVVGKLLRELGSRHQVLCVTHLPQVAACAQQHFQVQKNQKNKTTHSEIVLLDEQERINEVARMLGGVTITETTREHAREMLNIQV